MDTASSISDSGAIIVSSVAAGIVYLAWFLILYLRQASLSWKWEESLRKTEDREEKRQLKYDLREKFIRSRKKGILILMVVPVMHFLFYFRTVHPEAFRGAFVLVIVGVWLLASLLLYIILGMKKPDSFEGKSAGFDLRGPAQ